MGNSSSLATSDRIARLRRDLLRVRTREDALELGLAAAREILQEDASAVVYREAPAPADGAQGTIWKLASATSHDHGHLVVLSQEGVGATQQALHLITADLAQALDNLRLAATGLEASRLREEIKRRDEIVRLAGDALIRDAHEVVRVVAELEERDALIKADLQQALRFQRAMIAALPTHDAVSMSAIYLAAEMISGDFYDVAMIEPDWMRIFIADATGHGVAAGLATMFIKSEYEAQKRLSQRPAAILRAMNEQLAGTYLNLELQFTALCIDVDLRARRVSYASAAHPGPMLFRGSIAKALPSGGPFVGVTTGVDFPEHEVSLEPGDMLVAFSDGLLDVETPSGASFGESGVIDALAGANGAEACSALVRALASFVGEGRGLPDDVTIVALSMARAE